jgi:hypothetical protein
MSSIPTIAWVSPSVRRQLESYAADQGMCVEETAAELIGDRLRELKVTAPEDLPAQLPPVGVPASPGVRETALAARRITPESKWHESVKLRNARGKT